MEGAPFSARVLVCTASATGTEKEVLGIAFLGTGFSLRRMSTLTCSVVARFDFACVETLHFVVELLLAWLFLPDLIEWAKFHGKARSKVIDRGEFIDQKFVIIKKAKNGKPIKLALRICSADCNQISILKCKNLTAFWVSLRRFHSSPISLDKSGRARSVYP